MITKSTTTPPMMQLRDAQAVARALGEQMRPFCERIEIAGSIRREKRTDIKDVEIVAVPKWEGAGLATLALFDEPTGPVKPDPKHQINLLHKWAMEQETVRWIKTGTDEIVFWTPKPGGRYWRGLLENGTKLDLFLTTPQTWGATFLIRTGSREFSHEIVTRAVIGRRHRFNQGGLCKWFPNGMEEGAELIDTPEERDVFRLLGLAFVPATERTGPTAVRLLERPNR